MNVRTERRGCRFDRSRRRHARFAPRPTVFERVRFAGSLQTIRSKQKPLAITTSLLSLSRTRRPLGRCPRRFPSNRESSPALIAVPLRTKLSGLQRRPRRCPFVVIAITSESKASLSHLVQFGSLSRPVSSRRDSRFGTGPALRIGLAARLLRQAMQNSSHSSWRRRPGVGFPTQETRSYGGTGVSTPSTASRLRAGSATAPGRDQLGYSSLRQARVSSGCAFGVRSSRNEWYGATNRSGAITV
jgi:hypothetical protein